MKFKISMLFGYKSIKYEKASSKNITTCFSYYSSQLWEV